MEISRREVNTWLAGGMSSLMGPAAPSCEAMQVSAPRDTGSHIGSLYPFVQGLADRSPLELSFLRPEFSRFPEWKKRARARVLEHLFYTPPSVPPEPNVIRRRDMGEYFEEYLTFQTAPGCRVPAFVLLPKGVRSPAPGMIALHDHGGFYLWGKEKLIASDGEHPALTEFRNRYYAGKSTAVELVRQGYVVIVIDMLYWGERRLVLDGDPSTWKERSPALSADDVKVINRRGGENEQLVARSLMTAGVTWPGILLWDDLRTLDYLCSRPEVDPRRVGCVGLSVGGYRSLMLAALDERIRAAVDVGWMTSFASQLKSHVRHTIGFSFHLTGLYRYMDLPDVAHLVAPRALMLINGSQDTLFAPEGVQSAFEKIKRGFEKAQAGNKQKCLLYDAPHEFNLEMQREAWSWLKQWV